MSPSPLGRSKRPAVQSEIHSREPSPTHGTEDRERLLTKREVAQMLNLPSTRSIDELVRRRALPVIRFGWRTIRFSPRAVEAALEKLTVKAMES